MNVIDMFDSPSCEIRLMIVGGATGAGCKQRRPLVDRS